MAILVYAGLQQRVRAQGIADFYSSPVVLGADAVDWQLQTRESWAEMSDTSYDTSISPGLLAAVPEMWLTSQTETSGGGKPSVQASEETQDPDAPDQPEAVEERKRRIAPGTCTKCKKPRFWTTVIEALGLNLALNRLNYHTQGPEGFDISLDSWWDNIVDGWEFDPNSFATNQFAHPYHGGIYFTAARSNGYDYWQSIPFAALGSFTWEYFGETHRPALNDFISTTIGGAALGEIFFELSSRIFDNTDTGGSRVWKEIGGGLVCPSCGVNRLIHGESGYVTENSELHRIENLRVDLRMGARFVDNEEPEEDIEGFFAVLDFAVGDPILSEQRRPFDVVTLKVQINGSDKQTLGRLEGRGRLFQSPIEAGSDPRHALVVLQAYDYDNSTAYETGAQSVEAGIFSRFAVADTWEIRTAALARGIILGAVDSVHVNPEDLRDYDFGPGAGIDLGLTFGKAGQPFLRGVYRFSWIHNVSGVIGNHLLQDASLDLNVTLFKGIGVGAYGAIHHRESEFKDFDEVTSNVPEARAYVSWRLNK